MKQIWEQGVNSATTSTTRNFLHKIEEKKLA